MNCFDALVIIACNYVEKLQVDTCYKAIKIICFCKKLEQLK